MPWWRAGAALVPVLLAPHIPAEPLHAILGQFEIIGDFRTQGLLAAVPGDGAYGRISPMTTSHDNVTILRSDRLQLTLIRHEHAADGVPHVDRILSAGRGVVPPMVTGAALQATRVDQAAQMFLTKHVNANWTSDLELPGAACVLGEPDQSMRFPQDSRALGHDEVEAASKQQILSDCHAPRVSLEGPGTLAFYGIDLWLSSQETDRRIRTGTFEEPVREGVPVMRTVTQVLRVAPVGRQLTFDWEMSARVELVATRLFVTGHIGLGPHEGRLEWGSLRAEGRLDAFNATGEFDLQRRPSGNLDLDGRTLHPPELGARAGFWSFVVSRPLEVAMLLAGAAGIARVLLSTLFSRLRPHEVLNHPYRRGIWDLVRAQPGIERNAVARNLSLNPGSAFYHVLRLQRAGFVRVHRIGGRTALFTTDDAWRGREEQAALLRRASHRSCYQALRAEPDLDQTGLSERIGVTTSRVSKILGSLVSAGMVAVTRNGRRKTYDARGPGSEPCLPPSAFDGSTLRPRSLP